MSTPVVTPEVLWAQRSSTDDASKNIIYLTINAPDIPEECLKSELTSTKLTFSGESKTRKYAVELELYAEINENGSKEHHTGRGVEYVLEKKELVAEYWPRLSKESKKLQFIKTDFDKWVDEDEQEEVAEEVSNFNPGDMGGAGMGGPGMGGPGMGGGAMGGMDFASMMGGMGGGAGGMPDMSQLMKQMGGGAGAGEEDEDDEMPELEGDKPVEEVADATEDGSKVEEVK